MHISELRPVFGADAIAARVQALGQEIDACYGQEQLVIVCVLKGAALFFSDLVRAVHNPHVELDFVRIASYGTGHTSARTISFSKDVDVTLEGKHVLIVEDVVDTGYSMDFLLRQFAGRGAKSVRLAVLVDKQERREVAVKADFVGFALTEGFIVGYGLDYAEKYRHLSGIFQVVF